MVDLLRKALESPESIISGVIGSLVFSLIAFLFLAAWRAYKARFTLTGSSLATYEGQHEGQFRKSLTIRGIHGLFVERLTLKIEMLEQKKFEKIDVRFVEYDWKETIKLKKIGQYGLFKYKNIPQEIVYIRGLSDPEEELAPSDDNRGGKEGRYNPPKEVSGGGILWLDLRIKVGLAEDTEWNGYISFEHHRGGDKRRWVRAPVKIIHRSMKKQMELEELELDGGELH